MFNSKRAVIVLFVIGLCCTSLSADAAKDAWKRCSKALDGERKLQECSIAVKSGALPNDIVANALLIRASAYDQRGDFDQAIKDLDESIRLNPSSSHAVDTRGWEYLRKFDYKQAIENFDRAIELEPKNDYAYANRGIARFLSGDFANAEIDFGMSERLAPKSARAYATIKRTLAGLRAASEKGAKPDDGSIKIGVNLTQWPGQIIAYYTGVSSREAVLHAAQFPYANWKECQAYFYLGEYALMQGNRAEAIDLLQKSIDTQAKSDAEYALAEGELRNLRSLGNGNISLTNEK